MVRVTEVSGGCRQGEPGAGETSVDEVGTVLDLAQATTEGSHQVGGVGEGGVGLAAASEQGPDPFDRVELWRVGREGSGR